MQAPHAAPLAFAALAALLASCTTLRPTPGLAELEQELQSTPLVVERSIAELQALRPQLAYPFRLGIAPPIAVESSYLELPHRGPLGRDVWDAAEADRIARLAAAYRDAGLVDETVFLPRVLVDANGQAPWIERVRAAGARQGVDAVLVTRTAGAVGSHGSPLALLDLTIVGGIVLPAHEVESRVLVEGVLVDVRNGYVYLAGRGTGEASRSSPLFFVPEKAAPLLDQARLAALDDLARDLGERTRAAGFDALRQSGAAAP